MKKILLRNVLFFLALLSFQIGNAHVWEIRVNQNTDGSLVWYLQSYHVLGGCGIANSGLKINGVQYPLEQEFAGSCAGLSPTIFAVNGSNMRDSYAVVHTPFLGTTLSVQPYSTNVCWAFSVGGSGSFTPPPPPVCASFPVTGWTNTVSLPGNANGTECDQTDDSLPVTVTVNHQSCGSITGDGKFSLVLDPGGANIAYGPYNYSTGITTNVSLVLPYGFSNATQLQVIDNDFPGSQVTHTLSGIPGTQYLGVPDTTSPNVLTQNITVQLDGSGRASITPAQVNNGSSDACGIASVTLNQTSFNCSNVGANTVTLTATDVNGNSSSANATVTVTGSDNDSDGVPDVCDLDDDNDGILDTNECTTSNFFWSNPPIISGKTATGTINGIGYTYTSSVNVRQTTNVFAHSTFPTSFNVPNANPTIQNIEPSSNTLTFASPMTNPVLVFSSIGGGPIIVPINFSAPVEILWSNNTVHQISPTQITGQEGYAIVRMNGTFSSISFDYLVYENYVNFAFGADFYTYCDTDGDGIADYLDLDSDNDGCYDAIEGSLGLDPNSAPNGMLTGSIDSNGVPVLASAQGQGVGTSNNASANCFCELGIDNTNPIAAANNLVVQLDANGTASITPAMIDNGSTDNCAISSYLLDKSTFDCSNTGSNIVTLTVADAQGNISTATSTVTVEDQIVPTITSCPGNIQVNNTPSVCGANVSFTASATDNCSVAITYSHQPGSLFPVGLTTVTVTATDPSGNTAICNFNVEVTDVEFPNISCPFDIVVNAAPGLCGALVNYETPTGTDNCGTTAPPTSLAGHTYKGIYNGHSYFLSNGAYPPETAHAMALASGGHLATISSSQENQFISGLYPDRMWIGYTDRDVEGTWRWITNEPVVYTNWSGGEPNNAGNEDWAVINWSGPTWNDWYYTQPAYYVIEFDGGTLPANLIAGLPSGSVFPVGNNVVTYEVVDPSGNSVVCSFNVTVNDNQAPVAVTQNIVLPLDANGQATLTASQVDNGSTDNCGIASLSINKTTFDCSNVGANNVLLTVTDVNGKISSGNAIVTVVDEVAPVAVAQNITVQLDATGSASITTSQIDNGSTDVCGIALIELSQTAFDCSNVGSNIVTLTVTDVNGNVSVATSTVTVQDITAPVVIAQDVVVQLDENGNGTLTPDMVDNGSTDACGIASMALTRTDFSCTNIGESIPGVVTATMTVDNQFWIYLSTSPTDAGILLGSNGNWPEVTSYTANLVPGQTYYLHIKAEDVGGPEMFIGDFSVTGSFQFVNGQQTLTTNAANWTLSQTAFGINPETPRDLGVTNFSPIWGTTPGISSNARYIWKQDWNTSGSEIVYFSTPVLFTGVVNETILTVTDVNGNSSSQTVNVKVEDNIAPVALTHDITIQLDASGAATITPEMINAGSTDACGIASLALDKTTFDCSNVGVNTVILTVTDVNGNVSTGTAVVTVEDHVAPVVITQNVTIQLDASGQASVTEVQINNGSTDACGIASLALDKTTFDCSNVGVNTVTLTVTDVNGNVSTGTAVVTVEDHVAPVVITQNATIQLDASGQASVTAVQINNGSTDACGIASLALDKTTFDCSNVGTNTVILTVTDVNGNVSTGTAVVTVEDHVAPVVITQNVTIQLDASGQASVTAVQINNGSTDACGIASLALDKTTFDCSNVGANTVTLTVTDVNGNVSTGTAVVTVEDHVAPVVITQNVTIQLDASGQASVTAVQINNGSTDACGIASLALDKTTFECSNVGANTVILTVTDVNGNVSTGTAVVTVEDLIAPSLVVPTSITQLNDQGVCGAVINIGMATAADNCTIASIINNAPAFFPVGTTTVTWTATDVNGNSTSGDQTVSVYNNDPVINNLTVSKPALLGDAVVAFATYTDNNVVVATWYWGDGSTSSGVIGTADISGDHVYATTGLYDVKLVIEDACGKTDEETFSYTIVFNPCAGHVTGGGWINLTPGSYPAKPTLNSKATFEFELKYDGNSIGGHDSKIKFKIKETKFEFRSSAISWLMVNNDQAIFSGTGTINGSGNYTFVASVIDGDVVNMKKSDYFRIVIKDIAGNVVFDNQAGSVDAARATQKIDQGSIQIHKGKCKEKDDDDHGDNDDDDDDKKDDGKKSASIITNDFNVTLYPNPVRSEINLKILSTIEGNLTVEIFDMTGRSYLKNNNVDVFGGQVQVNVSNIGMVHGNYIMRVIDNTSKKSVKVLFNKE